MASVIRGNDNFDSAIGGSTTMGAVGTYIFGYVHYTSDTAMNEGDTIAGSAVYPAGARVSSNEGRRFLKTFSSTTLSGTWRIMGRYHALSSDWNYGASLFVRIS